MNIEEPFSPCSTISKEDIKKLSDDVVLSLVHTLSQISEQNKTCGIPPPKDFEESYISGSFISNDSSLFFDEISMISDVSEIQIKNQELKKTVKEAVKAYKSTSKEFLSRSILVSDKKNLLITELENVKNILTSAIEEQKDRSCSENLEKGENIFIIHEQIIAIQKDIENACKKLQETEDLLKETDAENIKLQEKLENLEKSLHEINFESEEAHEGCQCTVV
jgi:hypothetical protein